MSHERVLVVDDERLIRYSLRESLAEEGYVVHEAGDIAEALRVCDRHSVDCAVLDQRLPDGQGTELMKQIKELDPDVPVIMMTAYSSVANAVEAMRAGAFTYVNKPFDNDEMILNVRRALETTRLRREVRSLRRQQEAGLKAIVAESESMNRLISLVRKLARSRATTVMLLGESGTGKGLLARAIHEASDRRGKSFLTISCTAIPETLLESELFGHERGAFTDARSTKPGLFEVADGGTVFLDEIGDMPLGLQSKLLFVLEERMFKRLGGVRDIHVDVRVVAATNADLDEAVQQGRFRTDLFYRLNTFPIRIPPLRQRQEDIPVLAAHFVDRFNKEFNKTLEGIDPDAMEALKRHPWRGNVRELRNAVERAMILAPGPILQQGDFAFSLEGRSEGHVDRLLSLPPDGIDMEELERDLVVQALERTGGNQSRAAQMLGMSRDQIRYRIEKFRLTT
ncbi:MAG: sigma-54 dependent transcriptional regulator [Planctomycetota bacterium]|nr:sigma-54 dependent transcriptional regulator [Planctomycetota bacterium]